MNSSTWALGSLQIVWNTSSTRSLWSYVLFSLSSMRKKMLLTKTSTSCLRWSLNCSISTTNICSDRPVTCATWEVQLPSKLTHRYVRTA